MAPKLRNAQCVSSKIIPQAIYLTTSIDHYSHKRTRPLTTSVQEELVRDFVLNSALHAGRGGYDIQ